MKTPTYIGGWKSIFYSMHVLKETGLGSFSETLVSKNTCKVCAYGMGGQKGGMVNEANDKLEICKKSMQAYLTDIQPAISAGFWERYSIDELRKLSPRELERQGRLNNPILKTKGDNHYRSISWEEAFEITVEKFKHTPANKTFFYSSGRSSNEAAFLLHLFARIYGTNNVNNCSYYCHQASGVGMSSTLGTGTATIQLTDLKKADLIFVIGANPASNHPRYLTELMHCRRRGGEVIIINPAKEPGLQKFAIPSDVKSMLGTGSPLASEYLQPKIGGDMAVLYGIGKVLIENNLVNQTFIENSTENYEAFKSYLLELDWIQLEENSGVSKEDITSIAIKYSKANNVVFSWAMGITHHTHGVENVEAIVNLAMLRGMIGRKEAGLLPLRGHSNVQGIGSVGVTPTLKKQVFEAIESNLNVKLPTTEGWDTMQCMQKAFEGEVDIAFLLGGNLYASNPNLNFAEKALNKIPFKLFMNTTLNEGHLKGVDEEVLILPVLARDEEKQKTSQESMFNYVRLSEGGIDRLTNCKSEVEIIASIAEAVIEKSVFDFSPFQEHIELRKAIAKCIPGFEKMSLIDKTKEEFQIQGRTFHTPSFNTPKGKAIFKVNPLPEQSNSKNSLRLMSVRSEGQFNSIVYEEEDAWRGSKHRNTIFISRKDLISRGLTNGQRVIIKSKVGEAKGFELREFDIKEGSIMGFYPETNVLVESNLDPKSKTPAFKNTEVWIEPLN